MRDSVDDINDRFTNRDALTETERKGTNTLDVAGIVEIWTWLNILQLAKSLCSTVVSYCKTFIVPFVNKTKYKNLFKWLTNLDWQEQINSEDFKTILNNVRRESCRAIDMHLLEQLLKKKKRKRKCNVNWYEKELRITRTTLVKYKAWKEGEKGFLTYQACQKEVFFKRIL